MKPEHTLAVGSLVTLKGESVLSHAVVSFEADDCSRIKVYSIKTGYTFVRPITSVIDYRSPDPCKHLFLFYDPKKRCLKSFVTSMYSGMFFNALLKGFIPVAHTDKRVKLSKIALKLRAKES